MELRAVYQPLQCKQNKTKYRHVHASLIKKKVNSEKKKYEKTTNWLHHFIEIGFSYPIFNFSNLDTSKKLKKKNVISLSGPVTPNSPRLKSSIRLLVNTFFAHLNAPDNLG